MKHYSPPACLIGLGETGKEVLCNAFQKDWFIEEITNNNGVDNPSFHSFVLDYNLCNSDRDKKEVAKIPKKIENESDLSMVQTLEYINMADEVNPSTLSNKEFLKKIADEQQLRCWWLETSGSFSGNRMEEEIQERRDLGKAIYHASCTSENEGQDVVEDILESAGSTVEKIPSTVASIEAGSVGIIADLGEGIGSGTTIDLAKDIVRQSTPNLDVTLFGILPRTGEEKIPQANAYAALSELEHLALRGENPFYNIVLIPTEALPKKENNTKELCESVTYTIMSYYGLGASMGHRLTEAFDESPKLATSRDQYAPFTVASPQVIRYDVDKLQEAREEFQELTDSLSKAQESESILYNELRGYVEEYCEQPDGKLGGSLTPEKNDELPEEIQKRIDFVERFIEGDYFRYLGYQVDKNFRNSVYSAISDIQPTFDGQIEIDSRDKKEDELAELLRAELQNISDRYYFLQIKDEVGDEVIKQGLSMVLETTDSGSSSRRSNKKKKLMTKRANISSSKNLIDEVKSELESEFDRRKSPWQKATKELEKAKKIVQEKDEISSLFEGFEGEIKERVDEFVKGGSGNRTDFNSDKLTVLNDRLQELGVDSINEKEIRESLSQAEKAYGLYVEANSFSLVDEVMSIIGSDPNRKRKKEYDELKENVEGILTLGDWSSSEFTCEVDNHPKKSKIQDMEQEKSRAAEQASKIISDSHKHIIQIIDREEIDISYSEEIDPRFRIDSELSKLIDEFEREEVKSVVGRIYTQSGAPSSVFEAFTNIYLDPVDEVLSEKEVQLAEIEDILSIANQECGEFSQKRKLVADPRDIILWSLEDTNVNDPKNNSSLALEEGYIQRIITDYSILDGDDISETGLLGKDGESEVITKLLNEFAHNMLSNEYIPLNIPLDKDIYIHYRESIAHRDDSMASFDYHQGNIVLNLVASRIFEEGVGATNIVRGDQLEYITEHEDLSDKRIRDFGGPWDISMVTFVGGVFLDNLSLVTDSDVGYKKFYTDILHSEETETVSRHSLGIGGRDEYIRKEVDGECGFVYRNELIDISDASQLKFILGDGDGGRVNDEESKVKKFMGMSEVRGISNSVNLDHVQ